MHFIRLNHCFSFSVLVIRGANVAPSGALEIANCSNLYNVYCQTKFWSGLGTRDQLKHSLGLFRQQVSIVREQFLDLCFGDVLLNRAVDRPGLSGLCPGWGAQLPWLAKIRKKITVFRSPGIIQVWLGKNCHKRFYCWKGSGMTWGTPE